MLLYMREKLAITTLVIMLALFALIYRLWYIQHYNAESYNQKVLSQQRYDSREIPYRRGDIVDRNGTYLATTNKVYNLILDPFQINSDQEKYLEPTVNLLCEVFGYQAEDIRSVQRSEQIRRQRAGQPVGGVRRPGERPDEALARQGAEQSRAFRSQQREILKQFGILLCRFCEPEARIKAKLLG